MEKLEEEEFSDIHTINIPNFRCVSSKRDKTKDESHHQFTLFRSSRPDFLTDKGLTSFVNLKIKTIIDCRSVKEYITIDGNKSLDKLYQVCRVKLPHGRRYKPHENVSTKEIRHKQQYKKPITASGSYQGETNPTQIQPPETNFTNHNNIGEKHELNLKHHFIDFYTGYYIWMIYNRAPWYVRIYSIFFLLIDVIFNTGYIYFVQCFAPTVLNPRGLGGQYVDMVEMSHRSICAGQIYI